MKAEPPYIEPRHVAVELPQGEVSTAVYETDGPSERLPVVLLHGLGAWSYTWRHLQPALEGRRRSVAVDLLGHGFTGAPSGADYSPRGILSHVEATLRALKIERAVWAGNSLGGGLGLLEAIERPEAVAALVLLSPAGYPQRLPRNLAVLRWPGAAWLAQWLQPKLLAREMLERVFHDPSLRPAGLLDTYSAPLAERSRRRAVIRAAASIWLEDLDAIAERIPGIEAPALIIWGEEDRITPSALAHRYKREIAESRLVVLSPSGHAPQEERPAEVVPEVLAFLDSLRE